MFCLRFISLSYLLVLLASGSCAQEKESNFQQELPRIPPVPLAEALDTLAVAPGFRVEMVAHEPLVTDPVAMAFDEQGRLFVVEMRGYSERGEDRLGAVRMLTDLDGDGVFDKSDTYVDQLSWPTAVCCYDGGVFIGAAPDILYCKDTDGDGHADLRERIFTGFGKSNVQGLFNSFQWGLDNRIHGATSTSAGAVRRPHQPEQLAIPLRGRDFSFDPATLELRAESGGGQHGMSFDRWGQKFICANSDHLRAVIIPDRYLVRNPYFALPSAVESIALDGPQAEVFRRSPVEPWRTLRTRLRVAGEVPGPVEGGGRASGYFTSATGVTIYEGDAWPDEYQQNTYAIVGDVGSNIVHRKRITPQGASYRAERIDPQREFVASTDIWFRPVQFCNAPDGTMYCADFHREVIEHPDSLPPMIKQHLDLNSGTDRGRIYRIVPAEFSQLKRLLPGEASILQLVALLEHPNGWHRLTAARLLFEQQDPAAVQPLKQLVRTSENSVARVHALWVLDGMKQLTASLLLSVLDDKHPRAREQAIVLAEHFPGKQSSLLDKLLSMADDSDPRVRLQLALTLGEFDDVKRVPVLADILRRDGEDPWISAAVLSSSAKFTRPLINNLQASAKWASTERGEKTLAELEEIFERQQSDDGSIREYVVTNVATQPIKRAPQKVEAIEHYLQALGKNASTERGAKIFQKTCVACHDVDSNEGGIAPSVASFRNRGDEFLLVNILDPNREVNPQYLSYTAQTVNGQTFAGMITGETATSVTLTSGRDKKETILRIDIERMSCSQKSLMPEHYDREINEQQMADLISFLRSQQ